MNAPVLHPLRNLSLHRRYSQYKPSGVAWLGEIPAHWSRQAAKHAFEIRLGKMLQSEPLAETDIEIPYLKAQHVQWSGVILDDLPTMWASRRELGRFAVRNGDLLVCEGGDVGRAARIDGLEQPAIIQNALHRVRSVTGADNRFLGYVLAHASSKGWFDILCNRSTIAHFTGDKFGALDIPLPPPGEQRTIADFLDRETARIDALIEKKRRLIKLLQEKRAAMVAEYVTRGLSRDVPLKDSGIAWLGMIPAHWRLQRFKHITTRVDVGIAEAATHAYADNGVPLIRSTNVFANEIRTSDLLTIEPWFAQRNRSKTLRRGDLVTVRTGAAGTTAVVPEELDGCQCFTLLMSTVSRHHHSPYFCFYLNSSAAVTYFQLVGWGTAQINISVPILKEAPIPVPPLSEQRAIAEACRSSERDFRELMSAAEVAIARLTEYRAALISATVTGQIDIREAA